MKKQFLFFLTGILLILNTQVSSQHAVLIRNSIDDGPYFHFVDDELKVLWIENSKVEERIVTPERFDGIRKRFDLMFTYRDLYRTFNSAPSFRQDFKTDESIAIISDVHGEYNAYIKLLRASGIIDKNLDWIFGTGHLVVLGDIFDRGDKVTEILWHLFGLEKQAARAGGMVHVLLGNHELMTLNNNLEYLNKKYLQVQEITGTGYPELYSGNSVLGRWLRSLPVVITINDILFVHAGISAEMVKRNLKIREINRLFTNFIVGQDPATFDEFEKLKFLNETDGPVWYRGYFTDTTFTEARLDSILNYYGKTHIVVGHTTGDGIRSLYNNKVLAADAGIVNKMPGQILIYNNDGFYKVYPSGKRVKL